MATAGGNGKRSIVANRHLKAEGAASRGDMRSGPEENMHKNMLKICATQKYAHGNGHQLGGSLPQFRTKSAYLGLANCPGSFF